MGERAAVVTISPVQQMLASGTGALLTSVFGESTSVCGPLHKTVWRVPHYYKTLRFIVTALIESV